MNISVVVPAYNSENTLRVLITSLQPVLNSVAEKFEVILVNDGSKDKTWDVICNLNQEYTWVRGLNLMRNYGQHNALLCGIRAAHHSVIVTIDDDLQHPPEEIPKLIGKLQEGYDVVYGTPMHEQHGMFRDIASQATKVALQMAMGVNAARNVSAFRAFNTQVRESFKDFYGPFLSIDVLLTWGTTRFTAIHVNHEKRYAGQSNYNFRKLLTHALNMITGFTTLPLQLASFCGFLFTLFGMGILAYVLVRYFFYGTTVPGFPFLASIIAILSGAQLFALGVIGEYLARMHFRSMQKPSYVIRQELDEFSEAV